MLKTLIACVALLAVAMLLLSVRLIFKKNGRFVKTHVGQSKAMRDRGVTCVQSQDFAARHKQKTIKEH